MGRIIIVISDAEGNIAAIIIDSTRLRLVAIALRDRLRRRVRHVGGGVKTNLGRAHCFQYRVEGARQ